MAGSQPTYAATAVGAPAIDAPPRAGKAGVVGWLLYEWSAQPFYSLITTFLFGPFIANSFFADPARGQEVWGYAAAAAGLAVALLSPVLGAFADASGHRKPWIVASLILFMAGMSTLWLADPSQPGRLLIVLGAYVVAFVAAEVTAAFVNALMPGLVRPDQYGRMSGTSAAIGYLGGLTALVLVSGVLVGSAQTGKTMFNWTPLLTLDAATHQGDRLVGPFCALWLLLFSLPMLLLTPDRQAAHAEGSGLDGLRRTFSELGRHKHIILFLVARMLFTDGLLAMFTFGGIYGKALFGWDTIELGEFGIILIVAAMIGAAIGGWLDDRIGPKPVILIALVIAMAAAAGVISIDRTHVLFTQVVPEKVPGSGFLTSIAERWFLGVTIFVGLVTGPLSASSRSLMARLAPPDRVTQFFGLFAFSGRAAAFAAPLLVSVVTRETGEQRWGLAVVLAFLLAGLVMMPFVRSRREEVAVMAESNGRGGRGEAPARDVLGSVIVGILFLAALGIIAQSFLGR